MTSDRDKPATKGDLEDVQTALKGHIGALRTEFKGDIDTLRTEFKSDLASNIGSLRAEFKSDLQMGLGSLQTEFKTDIRQVAVGLIKTNERIDKMEEGLRQEMRDFRSDMTGKMDGFIFKMETLWNETFRFLRTLDEHGTTLRNHEERIQRLESQ